MLWDKRTTVNADLLCVHKTVVTTSSDVDPAHFRCVGALCLLQDGTSMTKVALDKLPAFLYELTPAETIPNLNKAMADDPDSELYRIFLVNNFLCVH